jgi:rSAM/selenodomain-associated transferase 2
MAASPPALTRPQPSCVVCSFSKPKVPGLSRTRLAAGVGAGTVRRISVVIPVLNEETVIAQRLGELSRLAVHEVVVVDGGSTDRTREVVAAHGGARLLQTPPGRAVQMNAGAAVAEGDVLLFLHADVALPVDAVQKVEAALAEPGVVAGAFRTWTVADRPTRLGPLLHLADVRSRHSRLPYGDQAPFVRADVFRRVGGFAPLPLMEDLELSGRLRKEGTIRIVNARVTVSGRRFIERPVFYTLLVNAFPALFRLGVPAKRLAAWYRHVR